MYSCSLECVSHVIKVKEKDNKDKDNGNSKHKKNCFPCIGLLVVQMSVQNNHEQTGPQGSNEEGNRESQKSGKESCMRLYRCHCLLLRIYCIRFLFLIFLNCVCF